MVGISNMCCNNLDIQFLSLQNDDEGQLKEVSYLVLDEVGA
jgi:hypothetical protein